MTTNGFTPSTYQKAIFDFVESGSGSAVVEAVAGSGKTSTIVEALKRIPTDKSVVFLAFNKAIAEELSKRVPAHAEVMTTHSLGFRAVRSSFGRNIVVDGDKRRNIVKTLGPRYPESLWAVLRPITLRASAFAKSMGIVPRGSNGLHGVLPDEVETWEALFDHFDVIEDSSLAEALDIHHIGTPEIEYVAESARLVLKAGLADMSRIDFDDMIYLPVVYRLPMMQFDVVFIDEAQDIAPIQLEMITRAIKPGGRLVAVGDAAQSIYGFRGADSAAIAKIAERFNATRLPLSISYRCAKAVVREAQQIVPHIESSETAPEGQVETCDSMPLHDFRPGDFVLCRFKAPIVKLAYRLLGARKPVKILGRDIAEGLVALIRRLKATNISDLSARVDEWHQRAVSAKLRKDPEADTTELDDKRNVIDTIISMTATSTVEALIAEVEALFVDRGNGVVTLSTIHKAKGLEAEKVYWLDSAAETRRARKPWQIQQETNLRYVAVTRAKTHLVKIDSRSIV